MNKEKINFKVFFILILGLILSMMYFCMRVGYFLMSEYRWYSKTLAFFLLIAEIFILIHGMNYLVEILTVLLYKGSTKINDRAKIKEFHTKPCVAVVVASFHEPLKLLEETLACLYNLSYENKILILLDDTKYEDSLLDEYKKDIEDLCRRKKISLFRRKWRGAKAGIINDFVSYSGGNKDKDFKYYDYSRSDLDSKNPEYLVVFDADQNPFPDFLNPLLSMMENNKKLAFVQTPQYYTNTDSNPIAKASSFQQHVFYEFICEGKGYKDAMFCCGTNVMFRLKAFRQIGGFREDSITEDFATSMNFHSNGWESAYFNRPSAFGMAPEDLGGYFKQQFRWALGTIGMFPEVIKRLFKKPRDFSFIKWWEYFISSSYYFIGFAYFILILCPILYLFFGVPTFFIEPSIYLLFFLPYLLITFIIFFSTLISRKYKFRDILLGQFLSIITFPIYLKADIYAIIGIKGKFVITPKKGSTTLPLKEIFPQFFFISLNLAAVVWGINKIIFENINVSILTSIFWCLYHFLLLSTIFYFNQENNNEDKS